MITTYFNHFLKKYSFIILVAFLFSCYPDESLNVPVKPTPDAIQSELDQYIATNFTEKYGMAIRYRFVDHYVQPGERTTPPRLEVVRPMLDFIQEFWIDPYLEIQNGEEFFKTHVPAEIVLLGGRLFNPNGTETLGVADAGAQITFIDVNSIDPENIPWRTRQLQIIYHEFAHIVHQRYKLPNAFETISPQGYTSAGSWFVLSNNEALGRGFVTPYATSSPNEDYAETLAVFLYDPFFEENFMQAEPDCTSPDCEERNMGREMVQEKLNTIKSHHQRVTGVSLDDLRAAIQRRL